MYKQLSSGYFAGAFAFWSSAPHGEQNGRQICGGLI
jgi:hypothetical protein